MAKAATGPSENATALPQEGVKDVQRQGPKTVARNARKRRARRKDSRRAAKASARHADDAESGEKGGKWSRRPFPLNTLEDALSIPNAIKDKTNGNPCDTDLVAKAVDLSKQSAKFYYLCASARDYGLTIGSRDTA
jgi:hypothetical protein